MLCFGVVFTCIKHSYSKQVKRVKVWKQMGNTNKEWASKVGLVTLLAIEWKEANHYALEEFLNTFVMKGYEIYFGRKIIVYVISK